MAIELRVNGIWVLWGSALQPLAFTRERGGAVSPGTDDKREERTMRVMATREQGIDVHDVRAAWIERGKGMDLKDGWLWKMTAMEDDGYGEDGSGVEDRASSLNLIEGLVVELESVTLWRVASTGSPESVGNKGVRCC